MENLCLAEDKALLQNISKTRKGPDRIVGFVYETENYDEFKKLLGNRDIDNNSRVKLKFAMNNKQLPIPGLINETKEVIDGQTRLEVCKETGLPFLYTVGPELNINDCVAANTNSKHWTTKNILQRFAAEGNENYKRFISLMDEFGLRDTVIMKASGAYYHRAEDRLKMSQGALVLSQDRYKEARIHLLEAVQCYETLNRKQKATKRQATIEAFLACTKADSYDHKSMIKACEMGSLEWVSTNKLVEIWKQIAPCYNYRRRQNFMDVKCSKRNSRPIFTADENNFQ